MLKIVEVEVEVEDWAVIAAAAAVVVVIQKTLLHAEWSYQKVPIAMIVQFVKVDLVERFRTLQESSNLHVATLEFKLEKCKQYEVIHDISITKIIKKDDNTNRCINFFLIISTLQQKFAFSSISASKSAIE